MLEHIIAHLQAGESTPDWDARKLRTHVEILATTERYMDVDQHHRFIALCTRLQARKALTLNTQENPV